MIVVSGRLEMRDWTDKEGNKRRSAEINVANAYFADSKRDTDNSSAPGNYGGYATPATPASDFAMLEDDDAALPF
jgi:single-strand DNA-binding protein